MQFVKVFTNSPLLTWNNKIWILVMKNSLQRWGVMNCCNELCVHIALAKSCWSTVEHPVHTITNATWTAAVYILTAPFCMRFLSFPCIWETQYTQFYLEGTVKFVKSLLLLPLSTFSTREWAKIQQCFFMLSTALYLARLWFCLLLSALTVIMSLSSHREERKKKQQHRIIHARDQIYVPYEWVKNLRNIDITINRNGTATARNLYVKPMCNMMQMPAD